MISARERSVHNFVENFECCLFFPFFFVAGHQELIFEFLHGEHSWERQKLDLTAHPVSSHPQKEGLFDVESAILIIFPAFGGRRARMGEGEKSFAFCINI